MKKVLSKAVALVFTSTLVLAASYALPANAETPFSAAVPSRIAPDLYARPRAPLVPVAPAASAATATITLTDLKPNASITVAPGTQIKVVLEGQVIPDFDWEVALVDAVCSDDRDAAKNGGGVFACFDRSLTPVLNSALRQFEAKIKAPSVPTTVKVTYAYFPPLSPGAQTAVKIFEVTVVVK